ncbi:hypothetical protein RB195_014821 [Necator americanus]|uniref:Uncharacterized protein n=2 Tax=Necator americanus TaxID=51031 RepID=A0ABR1E1W7_NECAM
MYNGAKVRKRTCDSGEERPQQPDGKIPLNVAAVRLRNLAKLSYPVGGHCQNQRKDDVVEKWYYSAERTMMARNLARRRRRTFLLPSSVEPNCVEMRKILFKKDFSQVTTIVPAHAIAICIRIEQKADRKEVYLAEQSLQLLRNVVISQQAYEAATLRMRMNKKTPLPNG